MTMDRRITASLLVVLAGSAAAGCRDAPLAVNVKTNMAPFADAGEMQTLEYGGSPVAVELDGSASTDPDGKVVRYRWLSGLHAPDGGVGRTGPDPDDVMRPTVMLDAGTWKFTLFVTDDDDGISQPSTVTIQVGASTEVPPEVAECSDAALQTIAEDCRQCLCGLDAMCRMATTGCDQACWDFYGCVQNQCADVVNDMAALPDCVRANCAAFFGGVALYMAVDPCLKRDPCAELCAASVKSM